MSDEDQSVTSRLHHDYSDDAVMVQMETTCDQKTPLQLQNVSNAEKGEIYSVPFVPKVIYIRLTSWETRKHMCVLKDS